MELIKIALTKGRIENAALDLFHGAGIDCSMVRDKGRKLIVHNQEYNIDFVLAKARDVVTYVDYGIVDIGIVGKDTLMEFKRDYYEVMDLKFGECKFALAGLKDTNLFEGFTKKRIATKYPAVAADYFRKRGLDVEIIKIEGSVELAPVLGLCDAIVDIVETGTTLKENGLVIIDDICRISTRVIVNKASIKTKREAVEGIINKLKNQLKLQEVQYEYYKSV